MQDVDQKIWDAFVSKNAPRSGAFLQSWKWGEFHRSLMCKIHRLEGVGMFIRVPLPWGFHYWYCPRGPIGSQILPSLGGVFVRFEPSVKPPKDSRIIKTVSIQPSDTLILDVSGSEEALLAGMHPKTRYNIMVGERKGVRIQRERAIRLGDELWDILEATADRGGFHLHPRTYYHALLSLCDLWVARKDHLPLAVALTIDFAGTRTYLHGGSTTAHRDLMAPSTLHWAIIKGAGTRVV